MKNSRKNFIVIEAVLAVLAAAVTAAMLQGQNGDRRNKISVIVQNSDDSQWTAFKYGLKMAAEDADAEMSVVSTGSSLTAEEMEKIIQRETDNGADGILVQPVPGEDTAELLKKTDAKIPVMLVESGMKAEGKDLNLSVVQPDHYACGRDLAEELLKDYRGNLRGKTMGLFLETEETEASLQRKKGFCDAIRDAGGEISWSVSGFYGADGEKTLQSQPWVDFIIAFDDSSLTAAGEASAARNLHGALIYGIGSSTEAVYYLDTGAAECLVVPDEFNVGYQSLTEMAGRLEEIFYETEEKTVSHTVLRRNTLFSEENQELLFTMSQ